MTPCSFPPGEQATGISKSTDKATEPREHFRAQSG
jgi:hypothetical protein